MFAIAFKKKIAFEGSRAKNVALFSIPQALSHALKQKKNYRALTSGKDRKEKKSKRCRHLRLPTAALPPAWSAICSRRSTTILSLVSNCGTKSALINLNRLACPLASQACNLPTSPPTCLPGVYAILAAGCFFASNDCYHAT